MSKWLESKTFAVLLFLSWLPLIAYLARLPSKSFAIETGNKVTRMMEASDIVGTKFRLMRSQVEEIYDFFSRPDELLVWISLRWGIFFIVVMAGLIAAMLALRQHHFWKTAVITTAGCYLLFIFVYSGIYLPSKLDARSWLMVVSQLDDGWLLSYRELYFPIMQFVLSVLIFFSTGRNNQPDAAGGIFAEYQK